MFLEYDDLSFSIECCNLYHSLCLLHVLIFFLLFYNFSMRVEFQPRVESVATAQVCSYLVQNFAVTFHY